MTALWLEGHATSDIGLRLGVSKNAVSGKVHRLELPARPSPIRRDGNPPAPRAPRPRRAVASTLPTLRCLKSDPKPVETRPQRGPAGTPQRLPTPAIRAPRPGAPSCCWPIGDPGADGFRFCDAPSLEGRPYCPEHCARAYRSRLRHERTDAA